MNNSQINRPIGIFDSGIGGLTVARALRKLLPKETLCYFGDTARVPYGAKSPETVKRYSLEITRFLISHNVKMIVVACNTVSSVSLPQIREQFNGPVIGVVEPGVRAAISVSKSHRIGVIGTKSTIQSGAYQKRLLEKNKSLHIIAQACPLFVPLVEEGWENDAITYDIAKRYLEPLVKDNLDAVILGCTHYPLIDHIIENVMGDTVQLVNSAEEAAIEVEETLKEHKLLSETKLLKDLFYASDDIEGFKRLYKRIFGDLHSTFVEAPSDFFSIVQQVHRFKDKLHTDPITWFEPY